MRRVSRAICRGITLIVIAALAVFACFAALKSAASAPCEPAGKEETEAERAWPGHPVWRYCIGPEVIMIE